MSSDIYRCQLDPETCKTLKIYLFKNVRNVEVIKENVIKGVWKCAVVKPSLIVDAFQVVVAANRAVLAEKSNTMVTKTVYSEILYNLSLTKNITQSLSKFGIEQDSNMMVCFLVDGEESDSSDSIVKEIQGEICPLSDLSSLRNMKDIKAEYKLNNIKAEIDYLDVIVSRLVTKNFVSH